MLRLLGVVASGGMRYQNDAINTKPSSILSNLTIFRLLQSKKATPPYLIVRVPLTKPPLYFTLLYHFPSQRPPTNTPRHAIKAYKL
ncbi:Serine/threonine-protein kinase HSL1 [Fusarium oxysporum f. sp. albedinis]|nr:Serine/threonine-protein kinase HSL1 [Fusarium oxysporum f. sp. albedinis]